LTKHLILDILKLAAEKSQISATLTTASWMRWIKNPERRWKKMKKSVRG